jgi:hypothetical protein
MLTERRANPRRRLRDRLPQHETRNRALDGAADAELSNLLLFLDDDVRESAKSLQRIERFLGDALKLLDDTEVTDERLRELSRDARIFDDLHTLVDTLGSLRARLGQVAKKITK